MEFPALYKVNNHFETRILGWLDRARSVSIINTLHAAGECRRQVKNVTKCSKNDNILEFHDHIWNHHEKCTQISTNMPGIGSLIHEIHVRI